MSDEYKIKKSQIDYVLNNNPCDKCNKSRSECGGCDDEVKFDKYTHEIPYGVIEYCNAVISTPKIEKELEYYTALQKINKRILNLYEIIDD